MFQVKLMALICSDFRVHWSCVWCGDNLNQLSKSVLHYFISYYGSEFLRLTSQYVYDEDDEDVCFYDIDGEVFFNV